MGDTFLVREWIFCGYAVERTIYYWGALAVDAEAAPEGKARATLVSSFWGEPQDGLQMVPTLYAGRATGLAGPFSATAANAAAIGRAHGQTNRTLARAESALGGKEDSRPLDRSRRLGRSVAPQSDHQATRRPEPG